MNFRIVFILFLSFHFYNFAQTGFEFKGQVNADYISSTAYLNKIEDLNNKNRFFTENIIQECKIDSVGSFLFKGDYLPETNAFYKIYIDNCPKDISHANHILDRCQNHVAIIFIGNNSSHLSFPLNNLNQIFCKLESKSTSPNIIQKIDSFQNHSLSGLSTAKNDRQRKMVYQKYFFALQEYSQQFEEPLAELYAFYLYSGTESFSRSVFLENIKTSDYYDALRMRLSKKYPNSSYSKQFENDISYFSSKPKQEISSSKVILVLSILLILSIAINFLLFNKRTRQRSNIEEQEIAKNYKDILTNQEQKVFELMHSGLTNKAIAETLFVSLSTIKTHINNIYTKLNISSRKEVSLFFDEE